MTNAFDNIETLNTTQVQPQDQKTTSAKLKRKTAEERLDVLTAKLTELSAELKTQVDTSSTHANAQAIKARQKLQTVLEKEKTEVERKLKKETETIERTTTQKEERKVKREEKIIQRNTSTIAKELTKEAVDNRIDAHVDTMLLAAPILKKIKIALANGTKTLRLLKKLKKVAPGPHALLKRLMNERERFKGGD